ncbi:hypothetical protein [Thauera sp. SDU_THAU2]|uniref:hypothetical protein n=1 Tax=Thauera sp. SDU_THAU2 TaxID=3136633 RepID=UPI0031203B19
MLLAVMYAEELELMPEQEPQDWRVENMGTWSGLYSDTLSIEAEITEAFYASQLAQVLQGRYQEAAEKCLAMVRRSDACAENMRSILSLARWEKMVGIYRTLLEG